MNCMWSASLPLLRCRACNHFLLSSGSAPSLTSHQLCRAYEAGSRPPLGVHGDVEHVVQAVAEVHVGAARGTELEWEEEGKEVGDEGAQDGGRSKEPLDECE